MGKVVVAISLVGALLVGGMVLFWPMLFVSSPKPVPVARRLAPEASPEPLIVAPVKINTAALPWASPKPTPRRPVASAHSIPPAAQPSNQLETAGIPWQQTHATQNAKSAQPPSGQPETAGIPWRLDDSGAIIDAASLPATMPSVASAANFNPAEIAAAELPWQTTKPAKHLAHPKLPDPVEYAQAIPSCPSELIQWLKDWEADQKANQTTPDERLKILAPILASSQLTFTQVFDLGQRLQNAEGDRVAVVFYHAAEPLAAAELAPLAANNPKAKPILDLMWTMQWCLGGCDDWQTALQNATLLIKYSAPGSREGFLARYQFAEATYEAAQGSPEARDKALAIYQGMLDSVSLPGAYAMTEKEQNGVHWAMGVILFDSEQYTDAIKHLNPAAQQTSAYYGDEASGMLVMALARLNKTAEAKQQLIQLVHDFPDGKFNMVANNEVRLAMQRTTQNYQSDGR